MEVWIFWTGLIWDIPIFGIFTPVLNCISPALAPVRASAATGSFVITNGVIRSDDLEIRSPACACCTGHPDLEGASMPPSKPSLMRDVWAAGPDHQHRYFWPVTKMLEYKVTDLSAIPGVSPSFFSHELF